MSKLIDLTRELEGAIISVVATSRLAYDSGQSLCISATDRRAAEAHDYILDQNEILTRRALDLVSVLVSHLDLRPERRKPAIVRKNRVTPGVTPKKPQADAILLTP